MSRTPRYKVGQIVNVVQFHYGKGLDPYYYNGGARLPILNVEFEADPYYIECKDVKITVLQLVVIEEHRVEDITCEMPGADKYYGYVLQDKDGNIWHNQYPYYNQSQLSTSDHIFDKDADDCCEEEMCQAVCLKHWFKSASLGVNELKKHLLNINYQQRWPSINKINILNNIFDKVCSKLNELGLKPMFLLLKDNKFVKFNHNKYPTTLKNGGGKKPAIATIVFQRKGNKNGK